MQYDPTPQDVSNESDVEQKIVLPLLTSNPGLGVPLKHIQTKPTIRPLDMGKGRNRRLGFMPDYVIWAKSLPTMIVEVKPPRVSAQTAYEEAQQYAHALNSRYPTGVNPAEFVMGINGADLLIGHWDSPPALRFNLTNFTKVADPADLYNYCGWRVLEDHATRIAARLVRPPYFRPYSFAGGQAILRQTVPLNNFALDLAPILRSYFSSETQLDNDEILTKGYVSSEDTTKYDAMLETFLRDSLRERPDQWGLNLEPTHRDEAHLTGRLGGFSHANNPDGHLQLVIGSVGSGKSIFIRRYHRHLMPGTLRVRSKWAYLDFNDWPGGTTGTDQWVYERFLATFEHQNPHFDLYDLENIERIFAPLIVKRERTAYAKLRTVAPQEYEIEKSRDLRMWMDDRRLFVEHLCRYFISDCGEIVVTVFDNVDRLGRDEQIQIFSVAQAFKSLTKSFCILQLRDETYERFKNEKPLDTYRTAVRFYIRPPRFVDVIKKRVWLASDYIRNNLPKDLSYRTEDGKRIVYSSSDLASFLTRLYQEIFHTQRNYARIVESLAARDTRKSLETFTRIITSGHLSALSITSIAKGAGGVPLREADLLRILMRTEYRLFSDLSGPISNIFFTESDWTRPSILLGLEILSFLIEKRRTTGEIGLQGYFTVGRIQSDMENLGFDRDDVLRCVEHLLERGLIVADELKVSKAHENLSVKVHASGFMHQRILSERIEYLYGVLTVVPFRDKHRCDSVAQIIQNELQGRIWPQRKLEAAQLLRDQLREDIDHHVKTYSVYRSELRGSGHTLDRIEAALERAQGPAQKGKRAELL